MNMPLSDQDGVLDAPRVGDDIMVLPVAGGPPAPAVVSDWQTGAGTGRARLSLGAVSTLAGHQLWLSARDGRRAALLVYTAHGHAVPERRDELALTGLVPVVQEPRRGAARAPVEHRVLLMRHGRRARGTTTVDVSAGGCRVRSAGSAPLVPGEVLNAALDVDAGSTVWARSEVVWVDQDDGTAALRFLDVSAPDRQRLDRDVLTWLTSAPPPTSAG